MIKIFKRCYHPGFNLTNKKKLCLPICPNDNISVYYKPVWGNKIQLIQQNQEKKISYKTNKINYYTNKISDFYNNDVIHVPTSHNTPIYTALNSLRNIKSDKFIKNLDNSIIDENGVFINTDYNRNKLMTLINYSENEKEKIIIGNAIYGIFSNFGDSIYIANDYLDVGRNNIIIANYPDKVSEREIERCRIVAYSLINGNYPIILDNNINFEGEANIKYLPAMIYQNNKYYQLCFTYNSSRSSTSCISNINKYLEKLELPLLKEIKLTSKKGMENYFYHLDCLLNFYTSNKYQYFTSMDDFWKNYKKNGTIVIEMNGISNKEKTEKKLNYIFENIIKVQNKDDLLAANILMMSNGIVGSNNLSNKYDFEKINRSYFFNHPSVGGGGAHKCCSNIMTKNKEISIDEWKSYIKHYDIKVDNNFIDSVKGEIFRIKQYNI